MSDVTSVGAIGNPNYDSDPQQEARNAAAAAQKVKDQLKANDKKKEEDEYDAMTPDQRASITAATSHSMGEAIAMSIISAIL